MGQAVSLVRQTSPHCWRARKSAAVQVVDYDPEWPRTFQRLKAGAFKFLGDEFFVWKDRPILGGEHLIG